MIKKISKIAIGTVIIIFVLIIFYIWFYEGSKPFLIKPVINEAQLTQEFHRLEQVENNQRHETMYENGKNKAILAIQAGKKNEESITLREQFEYELDSENFPYYELDANPSVAVVFYDWQYLNLKDKYFEAGEHNLYETLYGKEAAKGKPNYRYYIKFLVEKGESRYSVNAFCNSDDFLDEIITEFVNQVNSLE